MLILDGERGRPPHMEPHAPAVSLEDIARLAKLAAIDVSPQDAPKYAAQIAEILAYVQRLQAVDTSLVQDFDTSKDALPPDVDVPMHDMEVRERIIQQFPERVGDMLRVPSVFAHRA